MKKNVAIASLLLAWLCANGALLDLVQVFAWGKMFSGYVKTMPVAAALRETFDPAKPCDMCVSVASAKGDLEQKSAPATVARDGERLLLAFHTVTPIIFVKAKAEWPAALASVATVRREPVPVPPPRV